MPSETDIANYALDLVGEKEIVDIDEKHKSARLAKRALANARDELQRRFPWKTFILRAELAANATAPVWGSANQFPVPSETLKVIDVYVNDRKLRDWQFESGQILSDTDGPSQIRYIKRNTDYGDWDPTFVSAIAYRMATLMVESLSNSPGKKQQLDAEFRQVMMDAKNANALESATTPVNDPSNLEQVRLSGPQPFGYR